MKMDLEEEIQCLQENPETDSDRIMEFSGKEKLYLTELGELKKKLKKAETSLKEYEDENLDLRAQLAVYKDKEKEFKRQLEALSSLVISDGAHQRTVDLQRVYDQLLYKDGRIVELNNQILEKERQIMDLQEAVREQGEVALAKSKAVQIVNQRLQEIDSRHTKDASTETDVVFTERNARTGRKQRVNSPGRAIPQLRLGTNGSPPPLDPSEDVSSYTTETATYDDPDREWSPSPSASAALNRISKKYRKKVTFDLKPPGSKKEVRVKREVVSPDPARVSMQGVDNELAQQIIDLTNENDELRRIIAEIERAPVPEQDLKIAQLEEEVENVRRNAKNQLLRTRATAQAKMKEMETKIFELQKTQTLEVDSLNATNEALKSGRDFVLEENAKLLDELNRLKQKESDLMSELDGSVALSLNYRRELDTELRRITELRQELKDAQAANQQVLDEKQEAYGEVEKLKEALFAQGELIRMLEGDLIVYETQVGLLRDSLGASKVEVREQVKSKAISAVSALDEGKQQDLLKKRNDEKLKVKALHVKVRYLEQERDELLQWVQKHERFDFAPRSLEDLKRLATNRGTVAPSSVGPLPRSSVSSILTEPTVGTPYNEDNSVFNTTQSTVDNTVAELMKKLEIAHIENEKLGKELLETKSKNLVTSQGNILNLLETVENLSTVNPVDAIPGTYRIPEDTVDRDESVLRNQDLSRKEIDVRNSTEWQKEVEDLRNQLVQKDQDLLRAEMKNEMNVGSSTEWQKEIARLREENQNLIEIKNEVEEKLSEVEEDLQTIILEKERINEKLKEIEERNVVLSESNERVKKFERENNKLENLVEILRNQVEQFQFEAELSRTCLEDLRKNIISKAGSQNLGNVERNPSVDEVITTRTAMEALQRTGLINVDGGRQPQGNLNDRNQVLGYENLGYQEQHPQGQIQNQHAQADNYQGPVQNQPVQGPAQNQANQVENYQQGQIQNQPVQMENYQGAIQNQYAQVESYQQVPVQNQSVQLENYQHAGSAPPITEGSYYEQQQAHQQSQQQIHQQPQQQPQQHDAYQLPSASTGAMEAEFNQLRSQYSQLYSAYSQMQGYYEVREKELVDEKNNLNLKIEDLSEKLTRAEKSIEENFEESTKIENEYFLEKEKNKELEKITEELKETKTKLTANEGELVQLRNQMERMDNDYNQLRDTNKKLEHFLNETRTSLSEAESARNNLAAENSQLRQVKDQLEILLDEAKSRQEQSQEREDQLRSEVVSESLLVQKNHELKEENKVLEKNLKSAEDNINLNTESIMNSTLAAFDDEFDNYRIPRSTVNAGIQCDIIDNTVAQVGKVISGDEPHLNELLVNYVRETNNFNEYLSQDVENLFVLNNELASAADSLKGQVWALNEQLKKSMVERQEILDQLEKIEENNSSVFEENEKLRNELNEKEIILSEFKEQNDKWEKEVRNLQEKKFELEVAYGQLSEKYEQIQTTYENVISKMKIPKLDKSTDPLLDGSYFNSAQDVFEKYKNLETVSSQLKKDLESQTSKIRSLEEGIKENSSIGKEFFEDLSRGLSFENTVADAEARGAKSTAHSAMLEIKKLLMEAAETLHKLPIDEAYDTVRKETEIKCSRKVRNAVSFCEKVFSEMEKCESEGTESEEKFELPVGTEPDGIEFVILRLHERWKTKHNQLLESSSYLKNQQQLYRELESRLSDAQEKLAELETRNSSESAARLTAKQADNDALFRATAELAHTNVALQNQVDDLEEKLAGKVLDESEESEVRDVDSVSKKVEGVEDKDIDSKKLDTAVSTDFDSKKSEAVIDMNEQKKQDEVEKSGKKEISTKSKSPIPSTTEDWGWGEESTGDVGSSENPHPDADTKSKLVPDSKAKSKSPVSKAKSKSPAPSTTEDWGWGDEPTGDTGFSEKSPSESKAKSKSPDSGVKSKLVPDSKAKSKSPVPPTIDEWGWGEESTGDFGSEKPLHDDFNSKSKNFEEPKAAVDEWSWKEEEPDAAGAWDYDDETGSAPPEVLTEKTKETPVTKEEQDDWAWNEDNQESNSSKVEKPVEKIPDSKTSTSKVSSDSKASNAKKSKEPEKKEPSVDEWSWNEEPAIPKKQKVQEKKETPKKAPEPSKVEDWGWGDSEEIKPESTEPAKAKPSSKKTPKKPSDPEDWAWDDDFGSEPKDKGKSKKSSRRN
ncbi:hypothetical protein FO519_003908 [Halicephalobus sp. NKZ332]|nr:hypothetical protein FO519_003908 [Halicephalobus sp. NKZ332]